jgi:hypothetical protein
MPDVLRIVEGWDPRCAAILNKAPSCVDNWELVYSDPLPTWISTKARLALIGDAAVNVIFIVKLSSVTHQLPLGVRATVQLYMSLRCSIRSYRKLIYAV